MNNDLLEILREPFPSHQISYLQKGGTKLAYVGHAALTDRLLDADLAWNWEPLALTPNGLPMLDEIGGLWLKLTVAGVTRLGYGDAGDKVGGNAMKERIGDGLRNAAMRFGAALDLWHKGELHLKEETKEEADEAKVIDRSIWLEQQSTALEGCKTVTDLLVVWSSMLKILTRKGDTEGIDLLGSIKDRMRKILNQGEEF